MNNKPLGILQPALIKNLAPLADIWDDAWLPNIESGVLLPGGVPLRQDPEFFVDVETGAQYRIAMDTLPEEHTPEGLLIRPEREVLAKRWTTKPMLCTANGCLANARGYALHTEGPDPNMVLQCRSCGEFNYLTVRRKE